MELFWTPEAIQDRDDIYEYIEADNPAAALALDELFAEKAGRLVDHPGLGKPGRAAGTRELVAHQNYILVYDTAGDRVRVLLVLRVLHAARQLAACPPWLRVFRCCQHGVLRSHPEISEIKKLSM